MNFKLIVYLFQEPVITQVLLMLILLVYMFSCTKRNVKQNIYLFREMHLLSIPQQNSNYLSSSVVEAFIKEVTILH